MALVIACVPVLASSGLGARWAVAAPPGWTFVSSERVFSVNGLGGDVCVGDKLKFGIALMIATHYLDAHGNPVTIGRLTGQVETIKAASSDANVASVSPGSYRQGKSWPRIRRPNFTVTAERAGSATIRFIDGLGIARAVEEPVTVRECHYEIEMSSKWVVAAGFRPTFTQTIQKMRLDGDPTDGEYFASPDARNQATASAVGICVGTFDVGRSTVGIKVTEDPSRPGKLHFEAVYLPISRVVPEVCHIPGVKDEQGRGHAQIATLDLRFDVIGKSATQPVPNHVLNSDLGTYRGTTTITIFKVPN